MTAGVHIGCSGWIYRHWRELFYPAKLAQRLWFVHYSDNFRTVELSTSFYHLPKPETFAKRRDQALPGFRYAVKAPRFITHMKKLKDCAEPVDEFLGLARNLGETIGPVLYQLPPRWAPANMSAATATKHCCNGPTGSSSRRSEAATSGAISTTTFTPPPSTTL